MLFNTVGPRLCNHHSLYRQAISTIDCGLRFVLSARLLFGMLDDSFSHSFVSYLYESLLAKMRVLKVSYTCGIN